MNRNGHGGGGGYGILLIALIATIPIFWPAMAIQGLGFPESVACVGNIIYLLSMFGWLGYYSYKTTWKVWIPVFVYGAMLILFVIYARST